MDAHRSQLRLVAIFRRRSDELASGAGKALRKLRVGPLLDAINKEN